jgi:hypothetical protein
MDLNEPSTVPYERYRELERLLRAAESELEYMGGVLDVLRSDLQVKDEQFDFLFSSLRARTRQSADARELNQSVLQNRLQVLESQLSGSDRENSRLQAKLLEAEQKISALSGVPRSRFSLASISQDLIWKVVEFCDVKEVGALCRTSQLLRRLCQTDRIWCDRFVSQWLIIGKPSETYGDLVCNGKGWRDAYEGRHKLELNWRRQRCNITNLEAHNGTVTCLSLKGARMFSGSDDGSMICWTIDPDSFHDSDERLAPPPALPLAQLVDALSSGTASVASGMTGSGDAPSFHHQLHRKKCSKRKVCAKTRTFHGHGGPVWCLGILYKNMDLQFKFLLFII